MVRHFLPPPKQYRAVSEDAVTNALHLSIEQVNGRPYAAYPWDENEGFGLLVMPSFDAVV